MAEAIAGGEPLAGPTPPQSAAPTPVAVEKNVRRVYRAGGGRRAAFSAVFLLLLPFFASLGPMLWARVSQGHWLGTPGLVVLAIGFTAIMGLILVELLHSIRSRVELGEKAVRLTLPSGRGPTPKLMYRTHEVPYADIEAIETRRELYGGALAPVLLKGSRLMLKDGTAIPLGYVSDANVDPAFPFNEIAERIAARAGLNVTDRGTVRRSVPRKMLGIKASEDDGAPIEQAMLDELNRRHYRLVLGIIGGLVALIAVGIVMDVVSETAPPTVAAPAASAPAKPAR
ncbi:MAG: hypothetical protein AB1749_10355 [Pseudomonadota bacterium]